MSTEKNISFQFKARYHTLGELNSATKQIWFVIHGYGQLAQYFIKKFDVLARQNIFVIAPEGLSRFYLEDVQTRAAGGSNRVGATWMTRENRLMDIENYVSYLDDIYKAEVQSHNFNIPVTILGFSQGAATATRWILNEKIRFDQFILWAGIFPTDMNFDKGHSLLIDKRVVTVFGTDDPFITPPRVNELNDLIGKIGIKPEKMSFTGKHEMNDELLLKLAGL
ncbi:MAG: alpha/beta hydrolase [Cyclobacteriaceae bacterium]